ncbi:hypothetical protein BO78DRAFT_389284 [Aspergillus sclerotiicarbonarius CBS 121057]|uniref:Acetoacetate decarboxylase n=1 Tax=Aspergillus sclerotiicarbonarius (strain CBS 121057 / IBT 28362) TaxID=1448318 RepID=A0A319E0N6_ASPSB|nr:hypothetical protein BO78DRAFT_389284 [Aspergillus sclerotiicarbonarius CBS 121057]
MSASPYHRMPLGFGPFPGPRQTAQGHPLDGWDQAQSTTYSIVFRAPKEQLDALLPAECFRIESDETSKGSAFASVSFTRLENLPWLGGRGYNLCGLYIHNVICQGRDETVRGKYLSVLFEDRADPIISGREELGYAKLFASLDEQTGPQSWELDMGWEGTVFGRMHMDNLSPDDPVDASLRAHLQPENILHYKYIPRTGSPGLADVEYPTMSPIPAPGASQAVDTLYTSTATLAFTSHGFQALPTLHHIAEKLAGLHIEQIVGAAKLASVGASDFRDQRPILV